MRRKDLIWILVGSPLFESCSSSSMAESQRPTVYQCAHGAALHVNSGEEHATVDFLDHHYELSRRPSGLGRKYTSGEATLIIDGDTAVLARHNNLDLQTCLADVG